MPQWKAGEKSGGAACDTVPILVGLSLSVGEPTFRGHDANDEIRPETDVAEARFRFGP